MSNDTAWSFPLSSPGTIGLGATADNSVAVSGRLKQISVDLPSNVACTIWWDGNQVYTNASGTSNGIQNQGDVFPSDFLGPAGSFLRVKIVNNSGVVNQKAIVYVLVRI